MGGVELGYEVMDSVDYMVFSEEVFPAECWSWEALEEILDDPAVSGNDLGKAICDSAYGYFSQTSINRAFTLATVDLSKISALASALDDFGKAAIAYIQGDPYRAEALDRAAEYGVYMGTWYYSDLRVLMNNIVSWAPSLKSRADKVLSRLGSAVTSFRSYGGRYGSAGGLSIFHNFWLASAIGPYYPPSLYRSILEFGENSWADYVELMDDLYVEPDTVDDYEPDYPRTSNEMFVDDPAQYHTFHAAGDRDAMVVRLTGGTTYTIQTYEATKPADTHLVLLAPNGQTILGENDDIGGGNLYSKIVAKPSSTGYYFIVCLDGNNVGGDYWIDIRSGSFSYAPDEPGSDDGPGKLGYDISDLPGWMPVSVREGE